MRIRILALGLVCAASLCGQRRFSWQGYCFDHPAAPFCSGHDYAIKPVKNAAPPRDVLPYSPAPTPTVVVIGGVDWRFADPFADALAGFNVSGLSASPLARGLIVQLGANQGLSEADVQKIFDGLSGVEQVGLSVRDNRMVVMVTGRVKELIPPAPESGLKSRPVSGNANAILFGHPDAVDEAAQRIATNVAPPPPEVARMIQERQASSEVWAVGSAVAVGPEAVSAGLERFSLTVSMRNRLSSDLAFEFDGAPSRDTLKMWPAAPGVASIEGNALHIRMALEADEAQQKSGQIAGSPLGQRLAGLVKAARYLPMRDTTAPKQPGPVIFDLDGGPREVNQYPPR